MCPPEQARCFDSARGLRSHLFRAHARIRPARFYIVDPRCPVCGKWWPTRRAAILHTTKTRCQDELPLLQPLPADALAHVDPEAARLVGDFRPPPLPEALRASELLRLPRAPELSRSHCHAPSSCCLAQQ